MKALVKSRSEPGLWVEDAPEPSIGINDVLIRVLQTGICGTDVHIYDWDDWARATIPVPLVIGHEFVGEIAAIGSNVTDFQPGMIVSGEGHVVCGRCRNCLAGRRHLCAHTAGVGVNRPGAFAEYIALPMSNIWRHHAGVPLDVAAIFDPFGNAVHTALSFPVLGEDVLITGAGPIGLMAAAVTRHAGARHIVITDLNPDRLALALKMGVTEGVGDKKDAITERSRMMRKATELLAYAKRSFVRTSVSLVRQSFWRSAVTNKSQWKTQLYGSFEYFHARGQSVRGGVAGCNSFGLGLMTIWKPWRFALVIVR